MTLRQTRRQGSGSTETCLTLPVGGLRLVEVVQRPAGEHDDLAAAPLPVVVGRDAVDICRLDHVELAGSDDRHIAAGAAVVSCERAKSVSVVIPLSVSSCAGADAIDGWVLQCKGLGFQAGQRPQWPQQWSPTWRVQARLYMRSNTA